MTAREDFAPISSQLAGDLLSLCGELRSIPAYRTRADALCTQLGEALAIAGEHRSHFEMMAMELLEAIGRATGRPISTIATVASVKAATDALEHTAPVLAPNVVQLRAPSRDTQANIEAAAAKAFADSPPPLSAILIVDGRQHGDPLDMYQLPTRDQLMRLPGSDTERVIVRQVCWVGSRVAEVHAERTWPVARAIGIAQVKP